MKLTGQEQIAATRETVWRAMNDPEVLRRCIPGCQSLERESDTAMRAVVEIRIGPIGARFNGAVTLSDIEPAVGCTITGEGQGGTVGFAKGGARVRLADAGGGTLLSYEVEAQVGGRLAQLGGPIIDATAKNLASKFFAQFGQIVAGEAEMPVEGGVMLPATPPAIASPRAASGGLPVAWVLAVVLAALAGFLLGRHFASPVVVLDADLLARLAAVRAP